MVWMLTAWLRLAPAIGLSITPRVCSAPCDVRVQITIAPNAENRWYVVQLDGTMFQGTMKQLNGDDEPVTRWMWFKGLSAGEYEIIAVLYRQTEAARATTTLIVS